MKHHEHPQYSALWFEARSGIPTASEFHRIVTKKGDPSRQARPYMYQLICERVMSLPPKKINTYWTERGLEMEAEAASRWCEENKQQVQYMGFCTTDDGKIGCSPDRWIVGSNKILEIKCPAPWTHMGYLLDGPGDDYWQQVQGQLLVTGADAVHFCSYHPNMPLVCHVTKRHKDFIELLRLRLKDFCEMLDRETARALSLGKFFQIETEFFTDINELPGTFPWEGGTA